MNQIIDAGIPLEIHYTNHLDALHDRAQAELAERHLSHPTALNPSLSDCPSECLGSGYMTAGMEALDRNYRKAGRGRRIF